MVEAAGTETCATTSQLGFVFEDFPEGNDHMEYETYEPEIRQFIGEETHMEFDEDE